jgi:hypothetical protein
MTRVALLAFLIGCVSTGTAWAMRVLNRREYDRQMDRIREEWRWIQ